MSVSKLIIFSENDRHSLMLTYFSKTEDILGELEYQFCEFEGEPYVAVDQAAFKSFMERAEQAGFAPKTEVELRIWKLVKDCGLPKT
jgi:hypothetical protein